ncbi:MAG: glycosyltransferase family 2 protein [Candidatus Saelkia tenebricola]|nr:glycosyltransferase family 2 protein [Candidatus Saelkia tenebricola]
MKIEKISIVIPAFNEEESLVPLLIEINNLFKKLQYQYEVIVIDDGSCDSTWDVILDFSRNSSGNIKGVRLIKNYGQTAAIQVGFKESCGDVIIVMDADGQNDPNDIGYLIAEIEKGYDIVSGWRHQRKDFFLRVIMSWMGNFLVKKISGLDLHDVGCSLKAYRKEYIKDVKLLGEMHRILLIYLAERGARVKELKVNHRKRINGKSKYGMGRVVKLVMDLILYKFFTKFASKPIYMFGGLGFFSILFSFLLGLFVIYRKIAFHGAWISPLFFISVTFLTVGIIFIMLGILAELLVRIYYQTQYELPYQVKEKVNS